MAEENMWYKAKDCFNGYQFILNDRGTYYSKILFAKPCYLLFAEVNKIGVTRRSHTIPDIFLSSGSFHCLMALWAGISHPAFSAAMSVVLNSSTSGVSRSNAPEEHQLCSFVTLNSFALLLVDCVGLYEFILHLLSK